MYKVEINGVRRKKIHASYDGAVNELQSLNHREHDRARIVYVGPRATSTNTQTSAASTVHRDTSGRYLKQTTNIKEQTTSMKDREG